MFNLIEFLGQRNIHRKGDIEKKRGIVSEEVGMIDIIETEATRRPMIAIVVVNIPEAEIHDGHMIPIHPRHHQDTIKVVMKVNL